MARKQTEKAAPKIGRQLPTRAVTLPYTYTSGPEAVALYNTDDRRAFPWQAHLLDDLLAYNDEGLWVHSRFGLCVSRRNGKNEVVVMLELWAINNGYRVLHTAHRNTTAHSAFERLYDAMARAGIMVSSSYRALGRETISSGQGRVEFRTRTAKGGLGEGFDFLIVDEAQEYQDDQESALKYVVTDSENPLTLLLGTPPTPISSGTVFVKYRTAVLNGKAANAGWAEWGVETETDPQDRAAWYETNPSLGLKLTERAVADEITGDIVDFNIQRLGMWYTNNLKSAISAHLWASAKCDKLPPLKGKMYVGIKYGHDGENVSLSLAIQTPGNPRRVFVEGYDCRPISAGTSWIVEFLAAAGPGVKVAVVDGPAYTATLSNALKAEGVKVRLKLPSVAQIISANASFEQALEAGQLLHMGQPALEQIATNCEKRPIGPRGGFGYQSILAGADVSLLDSVILAFSEAINDRTADRRQTVRY